MDVSFDLAAKLNASSISFVPIEEGKRVEFAAARNQSQHDGRSAILTLLEQQARDLEREKDQLIDQKAKLMLEVDELKDLTEKMARVIVDRDKSFVNNNAEMDEYIDELEDRIDNLIQAV